MEVCGTGLGSWKDITAARNEDCCDDENFKKVNGDGDDGSKEKKVIRINSDVCGFISGHDIPSDETSIKEEL